MAGPGGKEAGRLRVKVVPDTDGFTRELEQLLQRYSKRQISIKVTADTRKAEKALTRLTRERTVNVNVDLDTARVESQIDTIVRDRKTKVKVKADVRSASAAINDLLRNRKLVIQVEADTSAAAAQIQAVAAGRQVTIQANARTAAANAQINRAARKREADIQVRLVGQEALRRLDDIGADTVKRVKVLVDDESARARLQAIGRDGELVAEFEVDERNFRRVDRWLNRLGPRFREASDQLAAGLSRIRDTRVDVRIRGTRSLDRLDDIERRRVARIKVEVDDREARGKLRVFDARRRVIAEIDVDEDNLRRVTKWTGSLGPNFRRAGQELVEGFRRARQYQEKLAQDRSLERRYREMIRQLETGLTRLGSRVPRELRINVDLDYQRRLAALSRELRRLEREARIDIRTELQGERTIAARLDLLTRRRTVQVEPDLDRRPFMRFTSMFGRGLRSMAQVGSGALSGLISGFAISSRILGNFGQVAEGAFDRLNRGATRGVQRARSVAQVIAQIVAALVSLGTVTSIITAIVTILGSIVVSAISALLAIGSVVLGAAALLALPAAFAAVAIALSKVSKEQDRFRRELKAVGETVKRAISDAATPMMELFTDALGRANDALRKGAPLYTQLQKAFALSAQALRPFLSGLGTLSTEILGRLNAALTSLVSSGVFASMAESLQALGLAVADVFVTLSRYGPAFANGLSALSRGLDEMAQALARLMGNFAARGGVETVNAFSDAITRLLDVFADNASVYTLAANSLARAAELAAPGFEKVTAALAKVSPGIFFSLGAAIDRLGSAASDPSVVSGLEAVSRAIVNLAGAAATFAVKAGATMGNMINSLSTGWSIIRGRIKKQADITKQEFQDILSKQDSFNAKIGIGLQQLRVSMNKHMGYVMDDLDRVGGQIRNSMGLAETETSKHVLGMLNQMRKLVQEWKESGGQVSEEWQRQWNAISNQVGASGNELLIKYRDTFNKALQESQRFRDKLKNNLIEALKAEGVPVNDTIIQAIEQQLGLLATSADEQTQQAINNIERNFNQLPGIVQRAMQEAKTPEELRARLKDVQKVLGEESGAIAEAFAELPRSMQETLTGSTTAFEAWTGMQVFKQKVTEGVEAANAEFLKIGNTLAGLNPQISTFANSFIGVSAEITVFGNSAAGAANGVRLLSTASNQTLTTVKGIGSAANAANTGLLGLSGRVAAITGELSRAGNTAATAQTQISTLGTTAASATSGFATLLQGIGSAMSRSQQIVVNAVRDMLDALRRLQSESGRYGTLTSFEGSLRASMARALGTVTSYVGQMLAQLSRLNTTVTTTHRINRVESGPKAEITPNSFRANSAQLNSWRQAAIGSVSDSANLVVGETRVYNVTVNAAPNVPTERQIVNQLRYADTIYS